MGQQRGHRRIRVLHLISDAGPHPYFELVGAHTDRARFDVRLATVGPTGALQGAARRMGLDSFALGAHERREYPRVISALARRLRRDRIDVIQTHLLDGCAVGLPAARIARMPAAIMTAHHCHEIPLHDSRTLSALDRFCARRLSDRIIAPSAQMRDTLVAFHRVSPARVSVIHHGFELGRLKPEKVDARRVRSELGLENRLVVGSIGRIYWIKNHETLVRAFAAVAPPEATLLLVGAGDHAPVEHLAQSLGVADRVVAIPPRDDVAEVLASIDLFVHPALAESFGMVIIEAMAMGRPALTTPVGIVPEVIEDGASGFLAADGSESALRSGLRRAFDHRGAWPAIANEARRRAQHFPADRMVGAYQNLYEDLVGLNRDIPRRAPHE